jgi:uncharacterized OsmC-like protein
MVESSGIYQGEKHCELTHGPSGAKIHTDAPKDNNGRGEAFSPTDLLGAALGSCILTTMAIFAEKEGLSIQGASYKVQKEMSTTPPRKVVGLAVQITMPKGIPEASRAKLMAWAEGCPVHRSLNHDIAMPLEWNW